MIVGSPAKTSPTNFILSFTMNFLSGQLVMFCERPYVFRANCRAAVQKVLSIGRFTLLPSCRFKAKPAPCSLRDEKNRRSASRRRGKRGRSGKWLFSEPATVFMMNVVANPPLPLVLILHPGVRLPRPSGPLTPFRHIEPPLYCADTDFTMKKAALFLALIGGMINAAPITSATVTLTGAGNPAVTQKIENKSAYIGPYTLSMSGISYAALCIDFLDDTPLNTIWSANITTLDNRDLGNTYHPSSSTQYLEAAYLFNQINTPGLSSQDRTALQDAAWAIFTPSALNGVMTAQSNSYLADAVRYGSGMMASQFAVVSSIDHVHNRQQEFLISTAVATPEPTSLALVGAGLSAAALAMRSRTRRKKTGTGAQSA